MANVARTGGTDARRTVHGRSIAGDVLQGLQTKRRIVNQLIEGGLPLTVAAGQFRLAHQAASVCLESATGVPSQNVDCEGTCRTLIGWVHLALADRPEEADRVSNRLERELGDYLERNARPRADR